ncbi:MAG TPA: ATP-binding protein [Kofleriaceae bacterium]|nr:ATP-binding protein [Kofleriaceae bacterium]
MSAPAGNRASRSAPVDPAALETLVTWLRALLSERLEAVRADGKHAMRSELEVLLAAPSRVTAAPPIPPPLAELARRLDARADETAILAVLLAIAIDPALGRAVGLLCDPLARDVPTREAITNVAGLPASHRITAEDALSRWGLIVRTDHGLALDPMIEARLLGRACRDAASVEHVALVPVKAPLPGWPIDELAEQVRRAIAAGARGVRLWMRGPEGSGRRTMFASIARAVGLVAATVAPDSSSGGVVRAAMRLARLEDLALVWLDRARLPADLAPPALQAWLDPEPPPPAPPGVAAITVRVPLPDRAARRQAWDTLVPAYAGWSEADRAALVDGWTARPGQLVAVALSGARSAAEAAARLRADATQQLEGHCEILDTPFEWDDLIVPAPLATSLRELANEARALPALWDDPEVGRLFPQGRSIAALFCGPPGTGKTMAAQVIARAVGLPLFRIDLSRIVSKYIGETSQNLARVLGAARHTDAVVFFDEADALFGRRTEMHDAHDRYANAETDYLLQALDAWPGVALLATNKRGNIDPAFVRRMRMILEFPRADAAERRRIWARLAPSFVGDRAVALAPLCARVADGVELSGAQIKAALLTARAAALHAGAAMTAEHLVRGVERELEKEGRSLPVRERAQLLG